MSVNNSLLFILGGPKTATTSLCGLINSHPEAFVMCEVFLNNSNPGRWGAKLLKAHPDALPFFFRSFDADRLENYRNAQRHFATQGYGRRYFGDKFADIDSGFSEWVQDARVIFSVRHLPEWLAKDSVRANYPLDANLVPFAVQYAKHFLESFLLDRVHHVRLEDFLTDNAGVVDRIWKFLDLPLPENTYHWWETIGHYPPGDPKACLNWWRGHISSSIAPQGNDTRVETTPHPFWNSILPIFDHYFTAVETGLRLSRTEVMRDIAALEKLTDMFVLSVEEAYEAEVSRSHNFRLKEAKAQRRKLGLGKRVMRLVGLA
jgi:Sulfotransferase family